VSIHRVNPDEALSVERYINTVECAELDGISGRAVAKRCALLTDPRKRELLWFIQGLSLEAGGLRSLAKELLAMFPGRIVRCKPWECGGHLDDGGVSDLTHEECVAVALGRFPRQRSKRPSRRALCLEEFFIDLCINPRLGIRLPGEDPSVLADEEAKSREEFPELDKWQCSVAGLVYFEDIVGALVEYKRRYEQQARAEFYPTGISKQVWRHLDETLITGTMTLIDGLEGRGKTEGTRAWAKCHLGVARFVSLDGITTRTTQLRELARSIGVGGSNSRRISDIQSEVKEILRLSRLMLVFDEAHFFFKQGARTDAWPEMLDWIDTALCNPPLPVALVTTPQFLVCMERAAVHVGWNFRQFRRRCKRYVQLPEKNSPADIERVTRHLLPGAGEATIKKVLAYEALVKRDLSGLGDIVREAKLVAAQEGASKVSFDHVKRAMDEVLLPGDERWAKWEQGLSQPKVSRRRAPSMGTPAAEADLVPAETAERDFHPRLSPAAFGGNRLRFQAADPALPAAQDLPVLTPA